jgi:NADH:ubiquinone oxidoreductase subunit H
MARASGIHLIVATVAVLFIAHPVKAVTESVAANNIAITFFAFIVSILFKIGIVSLVYYRAFRACWQAFSKLCKLSSISRKACGVSYAICYMIPKFG